MEGDTSHTVAVGRRLLPRRRVAVAVAALLAVSSSLPTKSAHAQPSQTLNVPLASTANTSEFRVYLGSIDITAYARVTSAGQLQVNIPPTVLSQNRDPAKQVVVVGYQADGKNRQLGQVPLPPSDTGGVGSEDSNVEPWNFERNHSLEINNTAQLDEGIHGDASPSRRTRYADLAGRAGLELRASRAEHNFGAQLNMVGSSVRNEALRFSELGNRANKAELADYVLDWQHRGTQLALGHIQFGTHPLLLRSFGTRGARITHSLGKRLELAAARMNGTQVVGFNNFFGLNNSNHTVNGMELQYRVVEGEKNQLGITASYLNAKLQNRNNFDRGEVRDASRNQGYGLGLNASLDEGRARATVHWASSKYRNTEDAKLNQGFQLASFAESYRDALNAELALTLYKQPKERGLKQLSANINYNRAEALYQSVGSYVTPDQEQLRVNSTMQLWQLPLSVQWERTQDNLDNIETILTTRTTAFSASTNLSLADLLRSDNTNTSPNKWLPTLSLSVRRGRQRALNSPLELTSGFNGTSHLPDQVSKTADAGLNWTIGQLSLGYTLGYALQDNRQIGRNTADFHNLRNAINLAWQATSSLGLRLSSSRVRNREQETGRISYIDQGNAGFNWQVSQKLNITANGNLARGYDTFQQRETRNSGFDAQINRQFRLARGQNEWASGQFHLRYAYQYSDSADRVFMFNNYSRSWRVTCGLTVNL